MAPNCVVEAIQMEEVSMDSKQFMFLIYLFIQEFRLFNLYKKIVWKWIVILSKICLK